jgi:hypothetical protein
MSFNRLTFSKDTNTFRHYQIKIELFFRVGVWLGLTGRCFNSMGDPRNTVHRPLTFPSTIPVDLQFRRTQLPSIKKPPEGVCERVPQTTFYHL